MSDKFIVKKSNIEGNGIFAIAPIKNGEPICVFQGERLSIDQLREKFRNGEERISDPLQIGDKEYLDLDEPYLFFNHSCQPNAAIIDGPTLIAIRDIENQEEITFDYSTTEWTDDSFAEWMDPRRKDYQEWSIKCSCGAPSCRGQIGIFPSLPKNQQDDYIKRGLVQGFIVRKYEEASKKNVLGKYEI